MNNNKIILWVEDNAQDESLSFIPNYVEEKSIELREATGVAKLARLLNEMKSNNEQPAGIILDMLIYGASDLTPFGIENVDWNHDATDVGFVLLKHIFRNTDSPKYEYLSKTPILILTVKPNINKNLINQYSSVKIAHKYDDGNPDWESDVTKWIDSL